MEKIKEFINGIMNLIFSVFLYIIYHILYPIGIVLMLSVIWFSVKFGIEVYNDTFAIEEHTLLFGTAFLFIINYYALKFIQEFTLMFNETVKQKMNNGYNIKEFTPEQQEDILSQFTPEERRYIEEQMELDDREVNITFHDEEDEEDEISEDKTNK